jgi:phosphoribosylaminoimidazole-succinocarboxamide synthase
MSTTIIETNFKFPGQTNFARGSVRDIYTIADNYLAMVVTDRISAFDVVLPITIPYKGQVLSQIATYFLEATKDIVPNWLISSPDPNVVLGYKCEPYKVEVVVRGYLSGHAWREYNDGKRLLCGVTLPNGLKENDAFPSPIITPATHAAVGHDEDISKHDIVERDLIPADRYEEIEALALQLFERGTTMAAEKGLILVDTKYEFGILHDQLVLMDEIHTPDSSRYFYSDTYQELQKNGYGQRQLSKEFIREWLITHDFQGLKGQRIPAIPDSFISEASNRYIELYTKITGAQLNKVDNTDPLQRIDNNVRHTLAKLQDYPSNQINSSSKG